MLDYSYDWCEFETMRQIKTGQLEIRVQKKGERVRLDCREEIKEGGMMRIQEEEKEKEDDERWEKWEIPGSGEGSVEEDESKMGLRTGERAMEMKEFPQEW